MSAGRSFFARSHKICQAVRACRIPLRRALETLSPQAARLPRVALALDDAACGEPGALMRLSGMHAELSDASLHGQEGLAALQRLVEETALLLGAPIEPRGLYGRALQLCWDGQPGGPRLMGRARATRGAAVVAGAQRRSALYVEAERGGLPLSEAIDVQLQRAPAAPLLDRLNFERLSHLPGLPMSVVSRLVLLGERHTRPVSVTVTLLGVTGVFEERRRLLATLSVRELVLLALLGQDPPISQAALRDAALPKDEQLPGRYETLAAGLLAQAGPFGLLEAQDGGAPLRLSRWGRLECDVAVLSAWLEAGQLWDALHLMTGPLPVEPVPWLLERRARILTLLYGQLCALNVTLLPAGERSRVYAAVRWMFAELAVMHGAQPVLGAREQAKLKAVADQIWAMPGG